MAPNGTGFGKHLGNFPHSESALGSDNQGKRVRLPAVVSSNIHTDLTRPYGQDPQKLIKLSRDMISDA